MCLRKIFSEPCSIRRVEPVGQPALLKEDGRLMQPFKVTIRYPYVEPAEATLNTAGTKPVAVSLRPGSQTIDLLLFRRSEIGFLK